MLAAYRNTQQMNMNTGEHLKVDKTYGTNCISLKTKAWCRQMFETQEMCCFSWFNTFNTRTTNPKLFILFYSVHIESKTPKCQLTQNTREQIFQAANVQINFQKTKIFKILHVYPFLVDCAQQPLQYFS